VRGRQRSDTCEVLGVVTDRYTVIQNREAFGFRANLLGSELAFETAGSLHGGKRVFVTCRLASIDHVEVGGIPSGVEHLTAASSTATTAQAPSRFSQPQSGPSAATPGTPPSARR
jgi:hypothetical protein